MYIANIWLNSPQILEESRKLLAGSNPARPELESVTCWKRDFFFLAFTLMTMFMCCCGWAVYFNIRNVAEK